MKINTVGIVGYGNFSKILIKLFIELGLDVKVSSRRYEPDSKEAGSQQSGFIFTTLEEIFECDVIIPSVPISIFEQWLKDHSQELEKCRPDQLLIEVCSVNELPAKWLLQNIKTGPALISSHPLFGPTSTNGGRDFANHRFLLHPLRTDNDSAKERFSLLKKLLTSNGLKVLDQTPADHDKNMAYSQAVTFLFGKIGQELNLEESELSTPWFRKFLEIQKMVAEDSDQLFWDMFNYNPYAQEMIDELESKTKKIKSNINKLK